MIFGSNAKLSKKINRELVLKTLYNYKPISRADIAKITGLTPASITKIIDEFIDSGLVSEIGNDISEIGRKPRLLDINKDDFCIIGLYVARKNISGIITNLNGEIKEKIHYKENYLDQPDLINKIAELIDKLLKNSKTEKRKVLGIGMAVIGPINAKKGEILNKGLSENPPFNWERLPLTEKIAEVVGLPVFADNDCNVSAMGESWFGNCMQYNNFALISFGEGVGGGLFLDGMLYRGEDDVVGEIGHTIVDPNGPKCECGNYGCLELYIKNSTIIKKYNELILKHKDCGLAKTNIQKVEDIYNFRDKTDPIYIEIINYVTNYLGIACINLINILNPEAIVISTNELEDIEMDIFIEKISAMVKTRAYPVVKNKIEILQSKLKSDIQLVGSISLVLRDFFELKDNQK